MERRKHKSDAARDGAGAVIRMLRGHRDPAFQRLLAEMHPFELRDLEERLAEAIEKEL